jgi:hypothetical protein
MMFSVNLNPLGIYRGMFTTHLDTEEFPHKIREKLKLYQEFTNNARQRAQEGFFLVNEAFQGNFLSRSAQSLRLGVLGKPDLDCGDWRVGSTHWLGSRVPNLAKVHRGFFRDRS